MAVRSCIPPVSTLPHGGQIVHSTSQHTTTWWSVNTVPHGGQIKPFHQSAHYHMVVRSNHSTSQHTTTRRSDRAFHQSTQYHIGGQMEYLRGKRRVISASCLSKYDQGRHLISVSSLPCPPCISHSHPQNSKQHAHL